MKTEEISYFKEALLAFLEENHPDLFHDHALIKERVERAREAYSESIQDGFTPIDAESIANQSLFEGLHFSKYATILDVLQSEFEDDFHEDQYESVAKGLLNECAPVFEKYDLDDEFIYSLDFDRLYTELTGTILIWIENGL